jgi:hypothetical protein
VRIEKTVKPSNCKDDGRPSIIVVDDRAVVMKVESKYGESCGMYETEPRYGDRSVSGGACRTEAGNFFELCVVECTTKTCLRRICLFRALVHACELCAYGGVRRRL